MLARYLRRQSPYANVASGSPPGPPKPSSNILPLPTGSGAWATQGVTSVTLGQPDPDGGHNACLVVLPGPAGAWQSVYDLPIGAPTAGQSFTWYAQFKASGGPVRLGLISGGFFGAGALTQFFDIPADGNWHQVGLTAVANSADTGGIYLFGNGNSGSSNDPTACAAGQFYAYNVQFGPT